MKVLTLSHKYHLDNFESVETGQTIQFIEKVPVAEGSTELRTVNDGTTNEEVLRMLIDRMQGLQAKFPCRENAIVITKLLEELVKTKPAPIHVAAKKLGIQRLAVNLGLHWNKVKNLCQKPKP